MATCYKCPSCDHQLLVTATAGRIQCTKCRTRNNRIDFLVNCDNLYPNRSIPNPSSHLEGVGTYLEKMFARFGYHERPGCGCKDIKGLLNVRGPSWCETNIEEILKKLEKNAKENKYPWNYTLVKFLLRRAIKKAYKDKE